MNEEPKLLDVVALLHDVPEEKLLRGQVGTIVETYLNAYDVEFVDDDGKTLAIRTLTKDEFIVLHYNLAKVA